MTASDRKYRNTHPWLTFQLDMRSSGPGLWIVLGEAARLCSDISLLPVTASAYRTIRNECLAEGIYATAALDGCMVDRRDVEVILSSSDDRAGLEGDGLSPIRRLVGAYGKIEERIESAQGEWDISKEEIVRFNSVITVGGDRKDGAAVPGFRRGSVNELSYRGAPAEDCEYLLERLCSGLEEIRRGFPEKDETVSGLIRAMLAHIYISWILPFEEGNGRTARMVEMQVMMSAGIADTAVFLLHGFYNRTQQEYRNILGRYGERTGDPIPFMKYALEGLSGGLERQLGVITRHMEERAWEDHLKDILGGGPGRTSRRRLVLATEISRAGRDVPVGGVRGMSAAVATLYSGLSDKTISRDIDSLVGLGVIRKRGRTLRPERSVLRPFASKGRKD